LNPARIKSYKSLDDGVGFSVKFTPMRQAGTAMGIVAISVVPGCNGRKPGAPVPLKSLATRWSVLDHKFPGTGD
jgi:hypothetical protein